MARRGRPPHPDILTPREWDVLALLRERLTNDQIAARLAITERTAKFHVSEILGKLGVASRDEAAAWQPEDRQRWWAGALAPLGFVLRPAGGAAKAAGVLIVGGLFAATIAGAALLTVLLVRSGDGTATISPSLIAFSAGGSIYTVRPDGSDLSKVIAGAAPAFSPDGTKIAFTRDYDIWIANSDGSDAHRLATVADLQTPPDGAASNFSLGAQSVAWSPDGEHIAYVLGRIGGSGVQDLWVMRADGSDRKELSRSGSVWEQAVWLDNDSVSVVAPGKILVFNTTAVSEPAITFLDALQQFSLSAVPAGGQTWLVGPITQEGPITLGSPDTGRKTVATGIGPSLAPGGLAFAYFKGDTLHIAHTDGRAEEQVLDLAPLGGRDRCFCEPSAAEPRCGPACSYRLPAISWTGSAEGTLAYLPALTYYGDALGIQLKYPGAWVDFAAPNTYGGLAFRSCGDACTVFGPANATNPYGVKVFSQDAASAFCGETPPKMCPGTVGTDALTQGDQKIVTLGGNKVAAQLDIIRTVPVGVTNTTGQTTPDHEIWTVVPVGDGALFLVAFWRDGDAAAEQETRSGYDVMLKSLVITQQQ